MKEFIKNNIKSIIVIILIIALSIVGISLAYDADDIAVNIGSGNYNVVYTGTATLPSSNLQPVKDTELLSATNQSKVMKIDFTVKGAQTNATGKSIIYDVSLTNLNLPEELKSEYLKWRLYKNGTQINEGNFSSNFDMIVDNRMVLTDTQQNLPSYSSTADSYNFYIWISETCTGDITECMNASLDLSNLVNKTFSGKIRIELSTGTPKVLNRPIPSSNKLIQLNNGATTWNAGDSGIYATNPYTAEDGTTKYHDYRYIGPNVNNYVWFNNDMYRIIGVFDDYTHGIEGEYLVKLIAANQLTANAWGVYNTTDTSGEYGGYANDWIGTIGTATTKANLNILLNDYFYNKSDTSTTYGACGNWTYYYYGTANYRTNSCTNIVGYGINSEYRNYIEEVTWHIRGYTGNGLTAQGFYECERGGNSSCTGANGSTNVEVTDEIGLMYVSDYMYASSAYPSTTTNTTGSSYYNGKNNWLFNGYEWTMMPRSNDATYAFRVYSYGYLYSNYSYSGCGVRPTFYLKSSVYISGGEGTFNKPYTLSM